MNRTERSDIVDVVKSEIKKFVNDSMDKEMKKVLHKSDSAARKEMVSLLRNGLESAFKIFWIKKDFWKTDIK